MGREFMREKEKASLGAFAKGPQEVEDTESWFKDGVLKKETEA